MPFIEVSQCSFYYVAVVGEQESNINMDFYNRTMNPHAHWTYEENGSRLEKCEVCQIQRQTERPRPVRWPGSSRPETAAPAPTNTVTVQSVAPDNTRNISYWSPTSTLLSDWYNLTFNGVPVTPAPEPTPAPPLPSTMPPSVELTPVGTEEMSIPIEIPLPHDVANCPICNGTARLHSLTADAENSNDPAYEAELMEDEGLDPVAEAETIPTQTADEIYNESIDNVNQLYRRNLITAQEADERLRHLSEAYLQNDASEPDVEVGDVE